MHFVDHTVLKLIKDPSSSTSNVLGLKTCVTIPSKDLFIIFMYMCVYVNPYACRSPKRPEKGIASEPQKIELKAIGSPWEPNLSPLSPRATRGS